MVGMFAVATSSAVLPQAHPVEASAGPATPAARASVAPDRAAVVSAADLWMAYSRDAASADRTYRGRPVTVTGLVRSIDRNYEGDMVVRFGTGDAFDTVNATLAARNDPAFSSLVKGRVASLLCVGRGALMGAPVLSGCFLR